MKCPKCGSKTFIFDSREKDNRMWRRRMCDTCGYRFTTEEITEEQYSALQRYKQIITDAVDLLKGAKNEKRRT